MNFKKEVLKIPNLISLYRLLLSFLIPFLWVYNFVPQWISLLILSGALSDTLDGNLARLLKQRTNLGKILDPLADKCFINMLFFLFYWEGLVKLSFFAIILARDLLILLGALYLIKRGLSPKFLSPSLLGKTSTVFQLVCLLVLFVNYYVEELPSTILYGVLNLTLFFTAASGFHYLLIFKRLSFYKVSPKSG